MCSLYGQILSYKAAINSPYYINKKQNTTLSRCFGLFQHGNTVIGVECNRPIKQLNMSAFKSLRVTESESQGSKCEVFPQETESISTWLTD